MYKDFIENLKKKWIGKKVNFRGKNYKVVDVDYNGSLLIDMPTYYHESYTSKTTAVAPYMVKIIDY